jgi:hypothetical protein
LNAGVIRKNDDHVVKTQTDPILYDKKMEELKDGEKGPSMPVMTLYARNDFMTKSAVRADSGKLVTQTDEVVAVEPEEGLPADLGGSAGTSDEFWWAEDNDQNAVKETPQKDDQH